MPIADEYECSRHPVAGQCTVNERKVWGENTRQSPLRVKGSNLLHSLTFKINTFFFVNQLFFRLDFFQAVFILAYFYSMTAMLISSDLTVLC